MVCIYKITSPSGKIYIGQTNNYSKRMAHYKGGHFKNQVRLYRSMKKYGFTTHVFEVVKECSEDNLNFFEREFQEKFNVIGLNGLNCKLVGHNDRSGKLSDETKRNISKGQIGKIAPPVSKATRAKLSKVHKGRVHGEKARINMSNSKKGKKNPMYGKEPSNVRRVILCGENEVEFKSLKQAELITGADFRNIQAVCKGRRKSTSGLVFKYAK